MSAEDDKPADATSAPADATFELKVDRKVVKVSHDEVIRRAQLGSQYERKLADLTSREQDLKRDAEGYAGYQSLASWMMNNREGAEKMRAIYEGRNVPNVQVQEGFNQDANPQLGQRSAPTVAEDPRISAIAARLQQQETALQQRFAELDRNALETRTGAAIQAQPVLKGSPEAQEYARMAVELELRKNPGADVQDLAAEAAASFEAMVSSYQQRTVDARLANQEFGALSPNSGGLSMAPPEAGDVEAGSGLQQIRGGHVAASAKAWLANQVRAATNPPGKR